jgi:hypothetical protein
MRLALAGTILTAELVPLSFWRIGHTSPAVAGQFWDLGLSKYLAGVLCVYFLFIFLSQREQVRELEIQLERIPIRWVFLAAQLPVYLIVFWLSGILHDPDNPLRASVSLPAVALTRLVAGFVAIFLAGCLVVPTRIQWNLLRRTYGLALLSSVAMGVVFAPQSWNDWLWRVSQKTTFQLVTLLLRAFTRNVISNPAEAVVGTPNFLAQVGVACSGVEGAQLMLAFSLTYLAAFRKECRFPHAFLLVPAGIAVLYFANTVRIVALILIGSAGAPGIAVAGFHSEAGWLAFLAVALSFCVVARHVPGLRAERATAVSGPAENPTLSFVLPFLTVVLCRVLATAATGQPQWMFFAAPPLVGFLIWLRRRDLVFSWMPGWRGAATGVVVFAAWMAIDRSGAPKPDVLPMFLSGGTDVRAMLWLLFRIASAVVTTPIAEELAFRGFGARRVMSRDFERVPFHSISWMGIIVSSAAFAALHGGDWVAAAIAGTAYGWIATKTGRLGEAITAHAVTNACITVWVLSTGQWHLW